MQNSAAHTICFLSLVLENADSFPRDEPYRAARAGRPGDIGYLVPASDTAALGLPFSDVTPILCLPMRCASALSSTPQAPTRDRKSTRLNSSHLGLSYAVF